MEKEEGFFLERPRKASVEELREIGIDRASRAEIRRIISASTRVTSGAPPGGGGALGSLAHTIQLQFWLYICFDRLARELETRTNLNGQCQ